MYSIRSEWIMTHISMRINQGQWLATTVRDYRSYQRLTLNHILETPQPVQIEVLSYQMVNKQRSNYNLTTCVWLSNISVLFNRSCRFLKPSIITMSLFDLRSLPKLRPVPGEWRHQKVNNIYTHWAVTWDWSGDEGTELQVTLNVEICQLLV